MMDSKFNAEKLYKKTMVQKWTEEKLFLKNRHIYKQTLEAATTRL